MTARQKGGDASAAKKPAAKTGGGKAGGGGRITKKARELNKKRRHEITGVGLIALGIFCLLSIMSTDTGFLGGTVKDLLFGALGTAAFLAPVILMGLGVITIMAVKKRFALGRVITCTVLCLALLVFGHLLAYARYDAGASFTAFVGDSYELGRTSGYGTGALGAVIAYPLLFMLGITGSYVIVIATGLCCLMLLTNLSLFYVGEKLGGGVKRAANAAKSHLALRQSARGARDDDDARVADDGARRRGRQLYSEDLLDNSGAAAGGDAYHVSSEMEPLIHELDRAQPVEPDRDGDEDGALFDTQEFMPPQSAPKPPARPVFVVAGGPRQTPAMDIRVDEPKEPDEYRFPPLSLLAEPKADELADPQTEMERGARKLEETLESFGISARVVHVTRGPAFTRFELTPSPGVKVKSITGLSDDIALNLAAYAVRIEAPIPGKQAIGIEIPNGETSVVSLREAIGNEAFFKHKSPIVAALGKDISGNVVFCDLARMPHMLIAGATGSGKSVCMNVIITSIIYKSPPEAVRFIMIDPKVVELNIYNGIPHLLIPVVTDPKKAASALGWAVQEMTDRYQAFAGMHVKDIDGYNELVKNVDDKPLMPRIVIIIDELADLMLVAAGEVEERIQRLTQLARAAGIHLVIATQRPSVNVITGVIKANIPSRIAFAVASQVDSRTILGNAGAEKLFGKGDMLYHPNGANKPVRLQGAWISEAEVAAITEYVKNGVEVEYSEEIIDSIETAGQDAFGLEDEVDDRLAEAIEFAIQRGEVSTSLLQRKLGVGYPRAGKMMDAMEKRGIVPPQEGTKARKVLISREEFERISMGSGRRAQADAPPFDIDGADPAVNWPSDDDDAPVDINIGG